jgi:hypothetical protein
MAIAPATNKWTLAYSDKDIANSSVIKTQDFAVGGKLVTATIKMNGLMSEEDSADRIKHTLMEQLIEYAIQNKLVEFTKIPNAYDGSATYIARCYLAPNETVKVLRLHSR